jgi:hypothetical protein
MALGLALMTAVSAAACGSSKGSGFGNTSGTSGTGGAGASNGSGNGGFSFSSSSAGSTQGFDVEPSALQPITVTAGQMTPTVTYKATLDGAPVSAAWAVDQGNIGSITAAAASTAVFTPSGTTGGTVNIQAGYNGMTVTRQVLVKLASTPQNGPTAGEGSQVPTTVGQLTSGGGVGGVGGVGLGPAVTNMPTLGALAAPSSTGAAQGLAFLYPYDKTVFPRGLLAPLLMWTWSVGDADAIQIKLGTTTGSFSWTGSFGRPAILAQTGGNFINSPIPQDVWEMATNTAGGTDQLTVSLTVAKGGVGYGPISETWTIAPTRLDGTIYYQSYGTQLAQNMYGAVGGNGYFGGAVLSIHVGDTAPKLAAGSTSTTGNPNVDSKACRVCHSVAAGGSRLVVQHGDNYGTSSAYDIATTGLTEHVMQNDAAYPAMYPDGSLALTEQGLLLPLPTDTTSIPTTGLTTVASDLGTPAFSPDGTKLVFNPQAGTLKNNQTLYVMGYDNTAHTFSTPTLVADDTANTNPAVRPGWGAFFPDSKSVVYHHQTVASSCPNDVGTIVTRSGSNAQIYWTNGTGPTAVTPLDQLNGKGYLPKLAQASAVTCSDGCGNEVSNFDPTHSDDVDHNYEPTIAPIASGGYVWVVFTSRRLYGNEATIPPFCSDPRDVNLITNITTKKLWVAAVDLTQAPGIDGSHPAFYLPSQELLAGNARGFWVLDPCSADGASCTSGDECCNGYCEAGDGGALICSNAPPNNTCSGVGDKCTTSADCCDMTNACINGFCTLNAPQ